MSRLQGKVAVVTGGAAGIGEATVRRFHAEGARVVIADVDAPAGEALAAELGEGAAYVALDVRSEPGWIQALATVAGRFGGLHVLVNNVGLPGDDTTIEEITLEQWDGALALNLTSVLLGCKHGIAAMRATGPGGAIVNVSSGIVLQTAVSGMAYSVAKIGVVKLTQMIARRCGEQGYGIRVNAVYPGVTNTPAARRTLSAMGLEGEARRKAVGAMHVLGRGAEPEELAAAILFLASDEAAFVTGAALPVDGGFGLL
jgi:3(or 17)beta-hydroxysteroid dehydrogenase